MILSIVKGGLGNQLYIYYFTQRNIKLTKHRKVFYDLSFYFPQKKFEYSNICQKYHIKYILSHFFHLKNINPLFNKLINKIGKLNNFLNLPFLPKLINEENYSIDTINIYLIVILTGHWINKDYYKEEIIIPDLMKKSKALETFLEKTQNSQSVSIHIRGGQYVNEKGISSTYATINSKYYNRAINEILKKISDPAFFVFTNDLPYANKILEDVKINNYTIIQGLNDFEDFYLMANCMNNIIINSTFSLWAAFLNENINKTIICPEKWSGKKIKNKHYDNLPLESWIKTPNT